MNDGEEGAGTAVLTLAVHEAGVQEVAALQKRQLQQTPAIQIDEVESLQNHFHLLLLLQGIAVDTKRVSQTALSSVQYRANTSPSSTLRFLVLST